MQKLLAPPTFWVSGPLFDKISIDEENTFLSSYIYYKVFTGLKYLNLYSCNAHSMFALNAFYFYRYQLFLQLKQDVLTGRLQPPNNISVQLAALSLQCKFWTYINDYFINFEWFNVIDGWVIFWWHFKKIEPFGPKDRRLAKKHLGKMGLVSLVKKGIITF